MIKRLKKIVLKGIKTVGMRPLFFNEPAGVISTLEWVNANKNTPGAFFFHLNGGVHVSETAPVVIGNSISERFTKYYNRKTNDAFVAKIPRGRTLGENCNIILSPDHKVLSDVSREFGAEGGKKIADFSVFNSGKRMPVLKKIKGTLAVLSTCGSANFHHWNYDILPRFQLLKEAGLINEIDFFLLNYKGLPFQKEGLKRIGVREDRIINTNGHANLFIEASYLIVPSLTEDLGTITPWVIDFLRSTFILEKELPKEIIDKLYISRRHASSRKIINEGAVMEELFKRGYKEFTPEHHSISETAAFFSRAKSIVSVHGSGLSNLAFAEAGTKVLDIMAPYHQDTYYWMITNQRKAKYVALFAEGEHPSDKVDLVKANVDNDLMIDIDKFRLALNEVS